MQSTGSREISVGMGVYGALGGSVCMGVGVRVWMLYAGSGVHVCVEVGFEEMYVYVYVWVWVLCIGGYKQMDVCME